MYNQFSRKYTIDHINWIRENRFKYCKKELIDRFNKEFNTNINGDMINGILRRDNGNTQTKSSTCYFKDTKEQLNWIKNNFDNYYRYNELIQDFNKEFNVKINKSIMSRLTEKLGLKFDTSEAIRYTILNDQTSPIGSEYETTTGHIMVKVNNISIKGERNFKKNWKLKQVAVWEKENGPVPKGYKIIFLDGNKKNFDLSNLRCVSPYVLNHIRSNGYRLSYYGYGKISDAMIEILKAQEIMNNINKGE